MKIGYIRVSTPDQNIERQLEGVIVDKKYIDYSSGDNKNRIELKKMMSYVKEGDHIYVHSIDRLARSLIDLRSIVDELVSKKVIITFLKENLHFGENNSIHNKFMLSLMGLFSEFEREIIKERQAEGIKLAKSRGAFKGGKKIITDEQKEKIKELYLQNVKLKNICEMLSVNLSTVRISIKDLPRKLKTNRSIKSQQQLIQIKNDLKNGYSYESLATKYQLSIKYIKFLIK